MPASTKNVAGPFGEQTGRTAQVERARPAADREKPPGADAGNSRHPRHGRPVRHLRLLLVQAIRRELPGRARRARLPGVAPATGFQHGAQSAPCSAAGLGQACLHGVGERCRPARDAAEGLLPCRESDAGCARRAPGDAGGGGRVPARGRQFPAVRQTGLLAARVWLRLPVRLRPGARRAVAARWPRGAGRRIPPAPAHQLRPALSPSRMRIHVPAAAGVGAGTAGADRLAGDLRRARDLPERRGGDHPDPRPSGKSPARPTMSTISARARTAT